MKNKIWLKLILLCVSVIMLATAVFADNVAFSGVTEENYFEAHPGVYEMGDGYAVIWATSFDGIGYITYTYEGQEYTVYDEIDGVIKTNEDIHVVKVPHEHLSDNEYTVHSVEVLSHVGDKIEYGDKISAGPIKLKGYDGEETLDLLVLTDIHTHLDRVMETVPHLTTDPDLIVVLGDTAEFIGMKSQIVDYLFNIMGTVSGGQYPIVYCRGNHETMGEQAALLRDYFPAETDGMYYDFSFGPLYAVVVDTGSDGDDTDYVNTINFEDYKNLEEQWLRGLTADTEATYRIAINHIPYIHALPDGADMTESMAHLGLQLGLSGHEHVSELVPKGEFDGVNYPVYICGVRNDEIGYVGSLVTLDGDEVRIKSVDMSGNVVNELTLPLEGVFGERAEAETVYEGLGSQVKLRNSTQFSFVTEPIVFENGEDYYTIVWATDMTSSGAVQYTYDGKTYQVFDGQVGGRTFGKIHSVNVPKAHLNGNEYSVFSFSMGSFYPYKPVRGKAIISATYSFIDPSALKNAKAAEVTKLDEEIEGETCAYIVKDGIVGSYDTEEDIVELLSAVSKITGSTKPVIISRDENGYSGGYGTELIKYIGSGGIAKKDGGEAEVFFPGSSNVLTYAVEDDSPEVPDRLHRAKLMFYVFDRITRKIR